MHIIIVRFRRENVHVRLEIQKYMRRNSLVVASVEAHAGTINQFTLLKLIDLK